MGFRPPRFVSSSRIDMHLSLIHIWTKKKLNQILSERTGQPLEVIERDTERDNFMTAEEAAAYGLIDKVIYTR